MYTDKIYEMAREIVFQITIWKEGKHFVAQCLNVDVSSFGKTKKEAKDNLGEALGLYFEDSKFDAIRKIEQASLDSISVQYA